MNLHQKTGQDQLILIELPDNSEGRSPISETKVLLQGLEISTQVQLLALETCLEPDVIPVGEHGIQ